MRIGRFFQVDENSKYSDGTVAFRYINISLKKEENGLPKYPIYMTMDSNSINFYFNGYLTQTDGEEKVFHREILHLPLSKNLAVKDNLTAVLVNAYHHPLPLSGRYKNEASEKDEDREMMGYSSLERFNKGKDDNICRYLILDFLFDLEHSRVFENSPFYEEVEIPLKKNLFFAAIAAKSAYDYNKKMFMDTDDNKNKKEIAYQNFLKSEREWLNCLLLNDAVTRISKKNKWFEDLEKELKQIKEKKEWKKRRTYFKEKIKEIEEKEYGNDILKDTSRRFFDHYNLWEGFRAAISNLSSFSKVIVSLFFIFHFLLVISLIINGFFDKKDLISNVVVNSLTIIYILFLIGCVIILIRKKIFLTIFGLFLPKLILAISSAWLIFIITEELWKAFFDLKINNTKWWFILLLVFPILLYLGVEIKRIAPNLNGWGIALKSSILLFWAWIISLTVGLIFTNIFSPELLERSGYLERHFREKVHYDQKLDKAEKVKIKKVLENIEKLEKLPGPEENTVVSSKSKKELDKNDKRTIPRDSLDLIEFLHSEIKIDFFIFQFKVYVFPGILIPWSIFALFFGILLEMVAQRRSVTESV